MQPAFLYRNAVDFLEQPQPARRNFFFQGVKDGPGPLITSIAKTAGTFPIPVAIVPGHLSDADLEAMA